MKTKFIFLFPLTLLVSVWACSSDQPSTIEETKQETTITEAEPTKEKIVENDLTTLEGFWTTFQKAVAAQDVEKLKGLFAVDADVYGFDLPEEQLQIAKSSVSDITVDIAEPEFHTFSMVFSAEEDRIATGDDSLEDSATIIYMKKNNTGEFRIYLISFAG